MVFWCFLEVGQGCTGNKWVNWDSKIVCFVRKIIKLIRNPVLNYFCSRARDTENEAEIGRNAVPVKPKLLKTFFSIMVIFGEIICISYNSIYKSNYCRRWFIYYSEINYLFWKNDVAFFNNVAILNNVAWNSLFVKPFEFNKEWIPGYIIKNLFFQGNFQIRDKRYFTIIKHTFKLPVLLT